MAKSFLRCGRQLLVRSFWAMLGLSPISTYADHKKYFKEGLNFELNKQWDKAAERFAPGRRREAVAH